MAGPKAASPPTQAAPAASDRRFAVTSGRIDGPQRVVVYGPGGVGKSTLAALAPAPVIVDIESGTRELDVQRIEGIETFDELRGVLQSDILDGFQTVIIDSATRVEELATAWTIANVPHEKGQPIKRIEDYGFGKGFQHIYDTFLRFLADCDAQIRKGRNVVLIAHDCVENVPNPVGEDWIRYEPHLQRPKSGKASVRNRVVQWADHVLFLGYDVNVNKDGKGKGGGTRTIYPSERPTHIAKSRVISDPLPFTAATDGAVWSQILKRSA